MKTEPKTIALSISLITILGLAVYGNSLNGEFILDDEVLIKNNVRIKNWSHLPKIFTEHVASGGGRKWNSYRPLQIITYMIDYSFWRLDVRGYHLTNILLHVAAALSIFWLIILLYDDWLISLLTGLFFAVHPIHTGAVAYISGRADSLAALFIILCLIFYLKSLRGPDTTFYDLALLSCVLALLSRENSLILPPLLLLYHYAFRKRLEAKRFLPVLGIVLGYILLRVTVLKSFLLYKPPSTTLFQRIPGFFVALTNYLRLLLLPFHLRMEYGNETFKFSHPGAIAGILLLLLSLIYAFKKRNSSRLIFFSISWFVIALLPYSNLFPLNAYMAEHWLYLPSLALFLIAARGLSFLYTARNLRMAAIVLTAGLLTFYSCMTVRQNSCWRKPAAFYERILKYAPDSPRTLNSLGIIYNNTGRKKEAIDLFIRAKEIRPDYADVYNNLAIVYSSLGRNEEAIDLYRQAIELDPDYAGAYNNLGLLYSSLGKNEEAIESYRQAIKINPDYAEAYNNLGASYSAGGRRKEAIELFNKAIELNPDYAGSYNNLGVLWSPLSRRKAIELFKQALEIDPANGQAHNNLAVAYYSENQYELAVKHCDQAVELGYEVHPEFLKLLERYR